MKVVYIAGKFRGKTAWNVAENVRAAERVGFEVASLGAMPLIPHANTAHLDGTLTGEFWLEGTMELLRRCDAVFMVPGWRDSVGAGEEFKHAHEMGLPVFEEGTIDGWHQFRQWLAAPPAGPEVPTWDPKDHANHPASYCEICQSHGAPSGTGGRR